MKSLSAIKVMSFNIRCATANDGGNAWEKRKSLTLSRIHAFGPHLLGLQECRDDGQAQFLRAGLPGYHFYGVHRDVSGETALEMSPLMVEQSAFQLIRSGHFWLSETPQVVGSKSWGSYFARTVVWAELLHFPSGRRLTFVNTHFDYHPPAVEAAARLLAAWLRQTLQDSPVIITGDFNAEKDTPAYRLLTEDGALHDAYRLANPWAAENEATFHDFGKPDVHQPIDWILVSRHFKVLRAAVDRAHRGSLYPSDHFPLLAEIEWRD